MRIDVVTLFPEFFGGPLATGLLGRSIAAGRATVQTTDPRRFTTDRHRTVDDAPYGGGAGMVMKPQPLLAAIGEARSHGAGPVVLLTPQGRRFDQATAARFAELPHLVLVAGRYEGVDERVREAVDEELSLGDYVLTGGEYAALVVADAVIRLLEGTVGNASSTAEDSFSHGLLEHPHFTRPPDLDGASVPPVLLGGDHGGVEAWRRAEALARTRLRRPDLLAQRGFDPDARRLLWSAPSAVPPVSLVVEASSDVELDAVARVAAAYGVAPVHLVGADPVRLDRWRTAQAWLPAPRLKGSKKTRAALAADAEALQSRWSATLAALVAVDEPRWDGVSLRLGVGGSPPDDAVILAPAAALHQARATDRGLLLVAAGGEVDAWLPPVRQVAAHPGLVPVTAAAIALDRLIGEG